MRTGDGSVSVLHLFFYYPLLNKERVGEERDGVRSLRQQQRLTHNFQCL